MLSQQAMMILAHAIKNHKIAYPDRDEIRRELQDIFNAAVTARTSKCPFCQVETEEDSFASSYGRVGTTTWTVDYRCPSYNFYKNIHTSTTIDEPRSPGGDYDDFSPV